MIRAIDTALWSLGKDEYSRDADTGEFSSGGGSSGKSGGSVPNPEKNQDVFFEKHAKTSKLTSDQNHVVHVWASPDFSVVNRSLRGVEIGYMPDMGMPLDSVVKNLDKAIAGSTLTHELTVNRFVNDPKVFGVKSPKDLVGKTLTDKGFLATSLGDVSAGDVEKGGMLFDIKIPKGSKALYLKPHLKTAKIHEVLLPRGTSLKVTGAKKKAGVWNVTAEIV